MEEAFAFEAFLEWLTELMPLLRALVVFFATGFDYLCGWNSCWLTATLRLRSMPCDF